MQTADTPVLVSHDGPVTWVTFNRPQQMNAFDRSMGVALTQIFAEQIPKSDARAVVVTGAGDNFMAGADLALLEHWMTLSDTELRQSFADGFDARMLSDVDVPVICAVDGIAFGLGFDLILAADYTIASDRSLLGLPESDVGVVPMGGSTYHLAQRVGVGRASRVQIFGEKLKAAQALEWGLVAQVVGPEELQANAAKVANRFAARSRSATAATKRLVRAGAADGVARAIEAERTAMTACLRHDDVREGIAAIREKRRPSFA